MFFLAAASFMLAALAILTEAVRHRRFGLYMAGMLMLAVVFVTAAIG